MANNHKKVLPVELQMDLLVDAELPESDRRTLLLAMDQNPGRWRELAIRFLERQTERKTTREFVGIIPAKGERSVQKEEAYRFRWTGHIPQAVAAGLMIAAISGVIVLVAGRDKQPTSFPVPVTVAADRVQPFFPAQDALEASHPSQRSVVIQPDGNGNAVVIPVNTLPMKFY